MIIDYAPTKDCKRLAETYGEVCIQCNDCERFEKEPFIQSDISIITQRNDGYPGLWRYPHEFGGYYKSKDEEMPYECWYRSDKLIKDKTTLAEVVPGCWYPERLPYLRWWIEGRKY